MIVPRHITSSITAHFVPGKVVILYGARRVGKSTLVSQLIQDIPPTQLLLLNGDDTAWHRYFEAQSVTSLRQLIGDATTIVIDEAQAVPAVSKALKLLVDSMPDRRVLVTGSSTLGLEKRIGEPLVGRSWTYHLYPFLDKELQDHYGAASAHAMLEQRLIYGSYPVVTLAASDINRQEYLGDTIANYLYADIVELRLLEKPRVLRQLLTLLAYQIGSEVSLSELAGRLQIDVKSVDRYLYLLEKSFVIFRLGALRRNLRNEVTKFGKYYFWDLGIRNALTQQFAPLNLRIDTGQLWENYLIAERRKIRRQPGTLHNDYFWRLSSGAEIDYVEEYDGHQRGYEVKWSARKVPSAPASWSAAYPDGTFSVINQQNYQSFVAGDHIGIRSIRT